MNEIKKTLGIVVRRKRKEMNLSQEQLSVLINKTPGFVGQRGVCPKVFHACRNHKCP